MTKSLPRKFLSGSRGATIAIAIVLNPGEEICHERNKARPDRQFGPHVVRNQTRLLKRNIRKLDREGFRFVHELRSPEAIDAVRIERSPLRTDRRGYCASP